MMHECEICGQACACDVEDLWMPMPDDCKCFARCAYDEEHAADDFYDYGEPIPTPNDD